MEKTDVAIVGSGAVGMAIAKGLLELDPTLRISIFEKETVFAGHASARNSGVLHAGFYYSPESMKAKFCREGRDELEVFAIKNNISIKKIGKVVVAQSEDEEIRLETLLQRGIANGVQLERLPASELSHFEPLAQTTGSFLWSPNTTISDPMLINSALRQDLISRNVRFIGGSTISVKNGEWLNNEEKVSARYFINAGGAWALDIAHEMNIEDASVARFIGAVRVDSGRHPDMAAALSTHVRQREGFFAVMIDLGIKRGEIASENRLVVQAFLLAVLIGLTDAVSEDHELQKRAIQGIKLAMRGQLVTTS